MFGVTYLQKVSDIVSGGIHIEPGIWASVPPTTNPLEGPTVARLASIPHGTIVLAQGTSLASITPFVIGKPARKVSFPESNLALPTQSRQVSNPEITQPIVDDPNSFLAAAIVDQSITSTTGITSTTVLIISTTAASLIGGGGPDGTAFLQGSTTAGPNASAAAVSAIFWIETVTLKNAGRRFCSYNTRREIMSAWTRARVLRLGTTC